MSEILYMIISTQNIVCSLRQTYTCIHHSVIHYEHTTSWTVTECSMHTVGSYLIGSSCLFFRLYYYGREQREHWIHWAALFYTLFLFLGSRRAYRFSVVDLRAGEFSCCLLHTHTQSHIGTHTPVSYTHLTLPTRR